MKILTRINIIKECDFFEIFLRFLTKVNKKNPRNIFGVFLFMIEWVCYFSAKAFVLNFFTSATALLL